MPRHSKRLFGFTGIIVVLAVAAYFYLPTKIQALLPKVAATGDEIAVTPKTVSFSVDATGVLRATSVQNFGAPPQFGNYWNFQIVNMTPEGKAVKAGDPLIAFDAQKMNDDLQRLQNELDQAKKELEKTQSQIDLERQELLARLATSENNYEKLKLKQATASNFEVFNKVEEDRLAFEQAKREVAALKERIDWHTKSSEATKQIILSKKTRAENRVNQINQGRANFQVKADRDGVVIYKTKWNGERFQVGENVWSGLSVLEIPDLNTIIVEAFVPEVDIGKLKVGQRVEVALDAFPGKFIFGKVSNMGTLVRPKAWDIPNKVLDVQIKLDQLDTSLLRPAMSVKTKIETRTLADCLAVPLKAVRSTADGSKVKVKTEAGWREQSVKLGDSNGNEVIVTEGIKAGEKVAADFVKAK